MNYGKLAYTAAAVALLASAAPDAVRAQQTAQTSVGLEEIVVTARRREERLQSVPVSVTAIGGDYLKDHPLSNAQDLARIAPSLNINSGNSRDINRFAIRGQGVVVFSDTGVVSYFSEVPLISGGAGPGYYYDLANIQVLNGPQGTLFGRNTTGGAVLFQPAKPTNQFEGYIQGQYGSLNERGVQGAVNVPLVADKLLLRIAGEWKQRDGFTHDVNNGRDYDNLNYRSGRISVTFKPTETVENYLMAYIVNNKNHGTGTVVTDVRQGSSATALFPTYSALGLAQLGRDVRHVALGPNVRYEVYSWAVTDVLNWQVTDDIAVKNIAAFQVFKSANLYDLDGTPLPILEADPTGKWNNTSAVMDQKGYTEELQVTGKLLDDKLNWLVGGFLEYDEPVNYSRYGVAVFNTGTLATGRQTSLTGTQKLRTQAVYTQESFDLSRLSPALDGFKLNGGVRRTKDFKSRIGGSAYLIGQTCSGPGAVYPNCDFAGSTVWKATTYNFGLDYQVTPDTLLYVTRRTGFKSGGFNLGLPAFVPVAVEPEKIADVEVGAKSDFVLPGDAKLRLNAAAYHQVYKNIQRNQFYLNPQNPTQLIAALANAAKAKIDGIDLQSTLVVGNVELTANYNYLNARYGFFNSPTAGIITGQTLPYAPRHSGNLSATWHLPIDPTMGDLSVSGLITYSSPSRQTDDNYVGNTIGDTSQTNFNLHWKDFLQPGIDVSLYVNNAFNRTYKVLVSSYYSSIGFQSAAYAPPRTYGLIVRYNFGN